MKEYNKKLTEEMHQKWLEGTKIRQLQEENNLSRDAIYKRFARLRQENAQEVVEVYPVEEKDNDVVDDPSAVADNEVDSKDNNGDMMPSANADILVPKLGNDSNAILYAVVGIGLAIVLVFYGPKIWNTLKKLRRRKNNANEFEKDDMDMILPQQYPY